MDPLHFLTKVPPEKIDDNLEIYTKPFTLKNLDGINLDVNFKKINLKDQPGYNPTCVYYPEDKYVKLHKLKTIYLNKGVEDYEDLIYPYENLNNSIFMNRCGLKLANIDKIFNLTNHNSGSFNLKSPDYFTFCDVAGGPGGFTQYLQYRLPNAFGYGITSKKHVDWKTNKLDTSRFEPLYGRNSVGMGNLYEEWESYINTVTGIETLGVDLVVADGGFDVTADKEYIRQEFLSTRLILIEILIGMICCKDGANFICKVFNTVTKISADLIYLCSIVFEKIYIFKPTTSRWQNAERYLVCMRKRKGTTTDSIINFTKKIVAMQTDDVRVIDSDLILPSDFVAWLLERNKDSMDLQQKTAFMLLDLMQNKKVATNKADLHKFLILLDVPGERYR